MNWKIEQAQQKFPELISAAEFCFQIHLRDCSAIADFV